MKSVRKGQPEAHRLGCPQYHRISGMLAETVCEVVEAAGEAVEAHDGCMLDRMRSSECAVWECGVVQA